MKITLLFLCTTLAASYEILNEKQQKIIQDFIDSDKNPCGPKKNPKSCQCGTMPLPVGYEFSLSSTFELCDDGKSFPNCICPLAEGEDDVDENEGAKFTIGKDKEDEVKKAATAK